MIPTEWRKYENKKNYSVINNRCSYNDTDLQTPKIAYSYVKDSH